MRQRYFFHIAYNGTRYRGWQRQTNIRSIQETIEISLAKVLHLPQITIIGCGRTDAEVHASQFFFHTDLEQSPPPNFQYILNRSLPADIAVFDIITTPSDNQHHARFSATSRQYDYYIHTQKTPFLDHFSTLYIDYPLDIDKMNQAVQLLTQYDDYRGLCKQPDLYNTTICRVSAASLATNNTHNIRFQITANRFLRGQIRLIVQQLLDIGTGKSTVQAFETVLKEQQRPNKLKPAPARGLVLSKVAYPFIDLPVQQAFMDQMIWKSYK